MVLCQVAVVAVTGQLIATIPIDDSLSHLVSHTEGLQFDAGVGEESVGEILVEAAFSLVILCFVLSGLIKVINVTVIDLVVDAKALCARPLLFVLANSFPLQTQLSENIASALVLELSQVSLALM